MAAPPLKASAILFDLGGTLDGDGVHWLDRFYDVYRDAGPNLEAEQIRGAFDFAERRAASDERICSAGFAAMVEQHVAWQWEALGIADQRTRTVVGAKFRDQVLAIAGRNAAVLRQLAGRGFDLGVISNGCGNTKTLCDDFGFTEHLRVVLDSRCAGIAKPDPRFFEIAAGELRRPPCEIVMVGDSLERDILPAKSIGMQTAWVSRTGSTASADVCIASVADVLNIVTPAK